MQFLHPLEITCGSEPARDEALKTATGPVPCNLRKVLPIISRTLHKMPLVAAPRDGLK
ncbi:hypothetical protein PMI22_04877 [Pseudomonas sp. GM21]|nr:hypothetical protein PMI22_04877 [Pseudomonas sp. GM21]MDR6926668.1 hypothetical protein [Pseudomonas sp. BE134]MDR7282657.1 hypothetical protein [Pseudomonas corrugata]